MNWKPIEITSRRTMRAAALSYHIFYASHARRRKRLHLTVRPDIAAKARLRPGQPMRLDVDAQEGMGRLLSVLNSPRSLFATGKGKARLGWACPWSGEPEEVFPLVKHFTELEIIQVGRDEIIFRLPTQPALPTASKN